MKGNSNYNKLGKFLYSHEVNACIKACRENKMDEYRYHDGVHARRHNRKVYGKRHQMNEEYANG